MLKLFKAYPEIISLDSDWLHNKRINTQVNIQNVIDCLCKAAATLYYLPKRAKSQTSEGSILLYVCFYVFFLYLCFLCPLSFPLFGRLNHKGFAIFEVRTDRCNESAFGWVIIQQLKRNSTEEKSVCVSVSGGFFLYCLLCLVSADLWTYELPSEFVSIQIFIIFQNGYLIIFCIYESHLCSRMFLFTCCVDNLHWHYMVLYWQIFRIWNTRSPVGGVRVTLF